MAGEGQQHPRPSHCNLVSRQSPQSMVTWAPSIPYTEDDGHPPVPGTAHLSQHLVGQGVLEEQTTTFPAYHSGNWKRKWNLNQLFIHLIDLSQTQAIQDNSSLMFIDLIRDVEGNIKYSLVFSSCAKSTLFGYQYLLMVMDEAHSMRNLTKFIWHIMVYDSNHEWSSLWWRPQ